MKIHDPVVSRLNIRSDYGGMGDQIARLPAFVQVIKENPNFFITIFIQDFALELCQIALQEYISNMTNWQILPISLYERARTILNTFEINFLGVNINSLRMHLTKHAYLMINNEIVHDIAKLNYLQIPVNSTRRATKENYVVVTTGFTAPARELPVITINEIIIGIRELGLTPVLLGSTNAITGESTNIEATFRSEIKANLCLDLRGKTDLLTAYQYLANSLCVLGLDNGLLHLASMSEVPVIWAFTTVRPEHRVPYRSKGENFVIEPISDCTYCQSDNMYLLQDFRKCIFNTYDCAKSLTSKRFLDTVKHIKERTNVGVRHKAR